MLSKCESEQHWDRSGEYESASFHRTTEMQSLWQASWLVANHSDLHFSDTLAILLLPFVHRRSLSPSGSTLLPSSITRDGDHPFGTRHLQFEVHVTWSSHETCTCRPTQNIMISTLEIHYFKCQLFLAVILGITKNHIKGYLAE